MKKLLLNTVFLLIGLHLSAQCDRPFISEYVEGYASNKALEIYNPTSDPLDLSAYWLMRFSNGSNSAGDTKKIQLPSVMLEPYDVFVVVVDLTDTADWMTAQDKPAWNGFNVIDTLFDIVTGVPLLDANGEVRFGPQYDENNNALFGMDYNEEYDLQCKADIFLCPEYATNNTMYFNGNDAMALVEGSEINQTGSNLLDVIGIIGEDPESATHIMEDAWVNFAGFWLTKDHTLVRKKGIATGKNNPADVTPGGSFTGVEWLSYGKNTFEFLGQHNSVCEANQVNDAYSCLTGDYISDRDPLSDNISANKNLNVIQFRMFPNPNSLNNLEIEADARIDEVLIYTLEGRHVTSQKNNTGGDEMSVDLSTLNTGMFLVRINFPDGHYSIQKLIRQ